MDCRSRQDQLLFHALGQLEGPELQELRAHLQTGCPTCQGRLSETQALLALLPLGLPPAKVPSQVRERLMDRVSKPGSTPMRIHRSDASETSLPPRGRSFLWPAFIGGAIAASVATVLFYNVYLTQRNQILSLKDQVATNHNELLEVREQLHEMGRLHQLISSPNAMVCDLKAMPVQPNAWAHLIWDPQTRDIQLYAGELKSLPPDRTYELWLINSKNEPHPAGTFQVDARGKGSITMTMPDNPGPIVASALSVEPWNQGKGVMQPTMSTVLMQYTGH